MKKHLSIVLTLTLVAVLLPAAFAQQDQSNRPSSAPQQDQTSPSAQSPSTPPSDADSTSFTGTVVKAGDKYVLKTAAGKTYQLDDQDKAKQFKGKQVKVSGSLDKATSMLHVTDISPADNR